MFAREWAGEGYEKGQTQLFYRAQLSQARTQAVNQLSWLISGLAARP